MTQPGIPELPDLLARLRLSPEERRAILRTDTEATLWKVRLLTAAAVYLNSTAVMDFGGRLGSTRGMELVEQVVGAAFQTYGGEDPHPEAFAKAAMLLRGITGGHPFQDGNKRTGFLVAAYYLDSTSHPIPRELPVDIVVALSRRVSSGEIRDVSIIGQVLEGLWGR